MAGLRDTQLIILSNAAARDDGSRSFGRRWRTRLARRSGRARQRATAGIIVAEATGGRDPELVIAALLHDAIEDQEVPRSLIAATWGEDVARTVEEVTDDKTLPKGERKRRQVETASHKSERANGTRH